MDRLVIVFLGFFFFLSKNLVSGDGSAGKALGAEVDKQGAQAGEQQGGLNAEGQSIALHQERHQNGGAEHGKHVLEAQNQHFGQAQLPGIADGLVVVHFVLLSRTHKKSNHNCDCR